MRTYKPLIFVSFLICTLSSFSQEKNDTKVIASISDSNLFNKTALILYERGYTIKEKDKDVGFIATNDKSIDGNTVRLRILLKDTAAIITGDLYNELAAAIVRGSTASKISKDESYYYPIRNNGMKKSGMRIAWNELVEVAKAIGGKLYYSK
jgi:hypothetical protein